ncbi:exonuclease domain-containing protein [Nonomuraea sp. SBT364]|uniref:exonuclease domain-containing protein n=1 Tax=Nonomuraea sp. SBT364 TaxID=1580530 RepID=UPI00066D6B9E|nr:exonuclease domain-containing protein [Nonomuraea sp. SBT364]
MAWHLGRLAPFDTETTGTDPHQARIVEAYLGQFGGGHDPIDLPPLLINPGVEIPAEATKIHGHTTEHVREHGMPAAEAIPRIATAIANVWANSIPIVGHNVRYDLTVLNAELIRHGEPPLLEWCGGAYGPVIDTLVISKHVDRWRRKVSEQQGAHALKTCAQVFGIPWNDADAHGARYDALISARIAWRIGCIAAMPRDQRPRIQAGRGDDRHLFDALAVDLPTLFASQQKWAAEQAASYQEWLRSPKAGEKRDTAAVISGAWPVEPAPANQHEEALA